MFIVKPMADDLRQDIRRARTLHQQGMLAEAGTIYHKILRRKPNDAEVLHLAGVLALQTGRPADGVELIAKALRLNDSNAAMHCDLGAGLRALRRHAEALASYDRAIALQPARAEAHHLRGAVLAQLGRQAEALPSYDRAVALKPDYAEAHSNRGVILANLQRQVEALASFDQAIAARPDYARAHYNRAKLLADLAQPTEALASYDQAVTLRRDDPEAWCNRGVVLAWLQQHMAALASFDQAIALRADYAAAHWNQANCRLALGQLDRGWQLFEWRKKLPLPLGNRAFPQPVWSGAEDLAGKTLFIHWEAGFGDTLHFCRYAKLAAARGARVVLSVQDPLRRLLRTLGAGIEVIGSDEQPDAFDYHCPMMSLPLALRTTLETIPGMPRYLAADAAAVVAWRERLAGLDGLRVGLCWSGNALGANRSTPTLDRRRAVALAQLAPLAGVAGVQFVSLQKGDGAAQIAAPPAGMVVHDWTDALHDFADTAALIEALDLVITVDTSVAHVAGALGKTVWILNRFDGCWRWLLERDDSPWYPSARLFRQPAPGDWDSVIAAVTTALGEVADGVRGMSEANEQPPARRHSTGARVASAGDAG
jgi:tetratricopeptide (TPR) repeat protein